MKSKLSKGSFLFLLFAVILAVNFHPASAQEALTTVDYSAMKTQLQTLIETQMKAANVTGLSIALVDNQKTVWSQGFGYANLEQKVPVTANTLFRIASISKLFTATAIMHLVGEGKIDLDQPLQTYLPEFTIKSRFPHAGLITVRSILTHHSGLPGNLMCGIYSSDSINTVLSGIKDEYAAYPPNTIYAYSNLGFSLLGIVIERVTGQKFNDYLEKEILKPLQMTHSSFILRDDMKADFSLDYQDGNPAAYMPFRDLAAGSMISSVNEISNFCQMLFADGQTQNQNLLSKHLLAKMLTPQNYGVPLDMDLRIGLGWHLFDPTGQLGRAGKIAWHDGGLANYNSLLITLPDHKLGVIILTNSNNGSATAYEIAQTTLRLALEIKTGVKFPESPEIKLSEQSLRAAEMKPLEGYYATSLGLIGIQPQETTWCVTYQGQAYQLLGHEGHWFSVPQLLGPGVYFQIDKINGAKVVIAKIASNPLRQVIGEAVPAKPLPESWRMVCGKYRIVNDANFAKYTMELYVDQNGFLTMHFNDGDLILTPVTNDQAIIRGLGRDKHETLRIIKVNNQKGLGWSGLKMSKVD